MSTNEGVVRFRQAGLWFKYEGQWHRLVGKKGNAPCGVRTVDVHEVSTDRPRGQLLCLTCAPVTWIRVDGVWHSLARRGARCGTSLDGYDMTFCAKPVTPVGSPDPDICERCSRAYEAAVVKQVKDPTGWEAAVTTRMRQGLTRERAVREVAAERDAASTVSTHYVPPLGGAPGTGRRR